MAENDVMNTDEVLEPVEVVHGLDVSKSLLGATLGATAAEDDQEPDEEYETIPVKELLEVKLGRQGENDTQTVVIDCSEWLEKLPGCQLLIAATRPGEREIYLPEVSVSSGVVTWPILEQDTACAGTGRAEVRAMKDGKVKKSALFRTRVEPALEGDGSPDAPTPPNWVRLIIESVEASQQAAEHAEELIEEATACAINAVRFDEAQGLTEEQKATGRGNIDAVGVKQGAANAGKVLMVGADGNVTTGDPVQIDATLTESGQAADAAAVGTALNGKVAISQGSGNAGKALVVDENGNVALGEAGVPSAVATALLQCFQHVAWLDDGTPYYNALVAALESGDVDPIDPTDFDYGVYEPEELVSDKYIDADGVIQDGEAGASYYIADFIPVIAGSYWIALQPSVIRVSGGIKDASDSTQLWSESNWRVSEYDSKKNFIKQTQYARNNDNHEYSSRIVNFDVNTKYIRLGWYDNQKNGHLFEIENPLTFTELPMELGDVSASTGENSVQPLRIRTAGYVAVNDATMSLTGCPFAASWDAFNDPIMSYNTSAYGIRCYDSSKNYLGYVSNVPNPPEDFSNLSLLPNTAFIRMIIQFNTKASFSDFKYLVNHLFNINGVNYYVTGE